MSWTLQLVFCASSDCTRRCSSLPPDFIEKLPAGVKLGPDAFNGTSSVLESQALLRRRAQAGYSLNGEGKAAFKEGVESVWVAEEDQGQIMEIVIPEGAKVIVMQAFYRAGVLVPLSSVSIPTTLEEVGKLAFCSCAKLTVIDLSNTKLVKLAERTFHECNSLASVYLPATLEEIDDEAFKSCQKLTGVDLSNTRVAEIGASAFHECSSLLSVFLPATLKKIGSGAFKR